MNRSHFAVRRADMLGLKKVGYAVAEKTATVEIQEWTGTALVDAFEGDIVVFRGREIARVKNGRFVIPAETLRGVRRGEIFQIGFVKFEVTENIW